MKNGGTYPVLGSALWGWTVERATVFALLDKFYEAGHRWIDTASNYPMNGIHADFRKSENLLAAWIAAHGVRDLRVIAKVGSMANDGGGEHNLSPAFLLLSCDYYRRLFDTNFACLMIHWDNRDNQDEIATSVEALEKINAQNIEVGLSGIRHPALYPARDFLIEIKHNPLTHDAYARYRNFHGKARFLAYGLTMGGVNPEGKYAKTSSAALRNIAQPDLDRLRGFLGAGRSLHQLGMLYAHYSPDIAGLILGPSTVGQLEDSLFFHKILSDSGLRDLYENLRREVGS